MEHRVFSERLCQFFLGDHNSPNYQIVLKKTHSCSQFFPLPHKNTPHLHSKNRDGTKNHGGVPGGVRNRPPAPLFRCHSHLATPWFCVWVRWAWRDVIAILVEMSFIKLLFGVRSLLLSECFGEKLHGWKFFKKMIPIQNKHA